MIVKNLFEYPVKGLLGNEICCATVNRRGLAMDRRWMLVDDQGNFLSQRQLPALTQFLPAYQDSLISPDDNMLFSDPMNDFNRLLLYKASQYGFQPVLFTELDMDGLLESAELAEREEYMYFRYYASTIDVHDQYILVPYSPITTAIQENSD